MSVGEMGVLWQPCIDELNDREQERLRNARMQDPLEQEARFHDVFAQIYPYIRKELLSVADAQFAMDEEMRRPTNYVFLREAK